MSEITVSVNREKHTFHVDLDRTSLADLASLVEARTGIPESRQKFILAGAVMKDHSALLSSYGMHNGSNVMLLPVPESPARRGNSASPSPGQSARSENSASPSPARREGSASPSPSVELRIENILNRLSGLNTDEFRFQVQRVLAHECPHSVPVLDRCEKGYKALIEQCMKFLLELDACEAIDDQNIRIKRKDAVQLVQNKMTELDEMLKSVKDAWQLPNANST